MDTVTQMHTFLHPVGVLWIAQNGVQIDQGIPEGSLTNQIVIGTANLIRSVSPWFAQSTEGGNRRNEYPAAKALPLADYILQCSKDILCCGYIRFSENNAVGAVVDTFHHEHVIRPGTVLSLIHI